MGKGGGGNISTKTAVAEMPVTPAVARDVAAQTTEAQNTQADARARMRGIRSTYNRFAESAQSGANGTAKRLG